MAESRPQPDRYADIRPRSHGATLHRNLDQLTGDELERLYEFLDESRDDENIDPLLAPGLGAALAEVYRRIGFRRRADRIVRLPNLLDPDGPPVYATLDAIAAGVPVTTTLTFDGPRCESPVCPGPHDVDGRHPAGWSV
jgi:hypothetical protein